MQHNNYNLATSIVTQVNKNTNPFIYSTVGAVGAGGAGGAKAVTTSSRY